jgi:hypothetical protein
MRGILVDSSQRVKHLPGAGSMPARSAALRRRRVGWTTSAAPR